MHCLARTKMHMHILMYFVGSYETYNVAIHNIALKFLDGIFVRIVEHYHHIVVDFSTIACAVR